MLAVQLLEDLRRRGVTLIADGDRLRFRPREAVSPELRTLLAEHKAELLTFLKENPVSPSTPIPALRQALREWYALTAKGADGDPPTPEEAQALLSEIRRLWDDVGPAFAETVSREEAMAWHRETKRCPLCGERGVFHEG